MALGRWLSALGPGGVPWGLGSGSVGSALGWLVQPSAGLALGARLELEGFVVAEGAHEVEGALDRADVGWFTGDDDAGDDSGLGVPAEGVGAFGVEAIEEFEEVLDAGGVFAGADGDVFFEGGCPGVEEEGDLEAVAPAADGGLLIGFELDDEGGADVFGFGELAELGGEASEHGLSGGVGAARRFDEGAERLEPGGAAVDVA